RVGLVTNLFAGTGEQNWGAALENLQLGSVIAPGLLVSSALHSEPVAVGKSMMMRRRDLAKLGGFYGLCDVLAGDFLLGRLFFEAGFEVRLSADLVENRNVLCSMQRTLERHSRWAKIRRSLTPGVFFAEPITNPLVVATGTMLIAPSRWSLAGVGI